MTDFDYTEFTKRNIGYVTQETQDKIATTKVLFAGCGLGSGTVICAARAGFQNFILVDGDVVNAHNLNRQFFDNADIGSPKVHALKKQILRINPCANVETHVTMLGNDNAEALVSRADVIFDTIDFIDLNGVLALHGNAKAQRKPIFTAIGIGFGAGVLYFPANSSKSLVELLENDIKEAAADNNLNYIAVFAKVVERIGANLDNQVREQVSKTLTLMEDGTPCPASQISVGSFTAGALAISMMHDMLIGLQIPTAPEMVVHSFRNHQTKLINIGA